MRGVSLIGIILGILLLVVAIPTLNTMRGGIETAAVASPVPALFAIFVGLAALGAVVAIVYSLAHSR